MPLPGRRRPRKNRSWELGHARPVVQSGCRASDLPEICAGVLRGVTVLTAAQGQPPAMGFQDRVSDRGEDAATSATASDRAGANCFRIRQALLRTSSVGLLAPPV